MAAPLARPRSERTLAWLYTGPLGHLWGVTADVVNLWSLWMLHRARARLRRRAR